MASADLLLHPVRLRIIQAFLGDRALTTTQLRDELGDVPPASLYRHVANLVDAGVLTVVSERRVRGAVERGYVLRAAGATVNLDDGVRFRIAGLWLSDAELSELLLEVARVVQPRLANVPKPGRRRRILGTVCLPGDEAPRSA
jgi:DNA-binding transcriptional ArsR family regulator